MPADSPRGKNSASRSGCLIVVDLFAGIGGFSEGFMAATVGGRKPFEVKLLADIDRDAAYAFKRNHPEIPYVVCDLRKTSGSQLLEAAGINRVDVLIGGPPCQGFSPAGKRLLDDDRNALLGEMLRLSGEIKPSVVVMENVPQLLTVNGGKHRDELLAALRDLGYDSDAQVLQAEEFGVPQLRRRAVIIAARRGSIRASSPFPEPSAEGRAPSVEEAIGDLPPLHPGDGQDPMPYSAVPQSEYQSARRAGSAFLFNHVARSHAPAFLEKIAAVEEGSSNRDFDLGHWEEFDGFYSNAYARLDRARPAHTITASFLNPGSGRFIHYSQDRSLTVREAARLQSFDDRFLFHGPAATQARHVGNAVPPLLARAVAEHIADSLRG